MPTPARSTPTCSGGSRGCPSPTEHDRISVVDVQRETLRSLFDAVADSYDQVGVDFFQPIAAGLVAELDPQPGERALDLGCGRGAALLPIARAVGSAGS